MPSELDKSVLFDLLEVLEGYLERKITLVAAGGTAMTLLNLKSSTMDVDFTGPAQDIKEFNRVQKMVSHGHKIDTYYDGAVFSQILPDDYLSLSRKIEAPLAKIDLRALHPVDIVVTKIGRLDGKDLQDIESCIKEANLGKSQIAERAGMVGYAGNEMVYAANLEHVLQRFFPDNRKAK